MNQLADRCFYANGYESDQIPAFNFTQSAVPSVLTPKVAGFLPKVFTAQVRVFNIARINFGGGPKEAEILLSSEIFRHINAHPTFSVLLNSNTAFGF